MKLTKTRIEAVRVIYAVLLACALLAPCGSTALAAEGRPAEIRQTAPPPATGIPQPQHTGDAVESIATELYPTDVKTVATSAGRQIIKTYILSPQQSPADIPRDSFSRDGWLYAITDITEKRTSGTESYSHTETVEIETKTKELNEIIILLSPTIDYQSEDGYCGVLTLDLASVSCEAAGHRNSSHTVSATREYPHLSCADTSLIPKTITDKGRELGLDSVTWEVQHYVTIDYVDIPETYRAIAHYSARVSRSAITGYVTTADYTGEVSRTVMGDTAYTAYFVGTEIAPPPRLAETPSIAPPLAAVPETGESPLPAAQSGRVPFALLLIMTAVLFAIVGAGVYWFLLRSNVKIYKVSEGSRVLTEKRRIGAKQMVIDLTPLECSRYELEIARHAAKALNGKVLEVLYGPVCLKHTIAYEGNPYRADVNISTGTIKAIY